MRATFFRTSPPHRAGYFAARWQATGVFSFTGSPQCAQADGLWVLIDPPSVGRLTINLKLAHPALCGPIGAPWKVSLTR